MAVEDLFADVKSEGNAIEDAFERLETKGEKPSESRTEKEGEATEGTNTQETPKESKAWAQMRREVKEAKETAAKAIADAESLKKGSQPVSVPNWFGRYKDETDEARQKRFEAIVAKDGELDWIKQNVLSELEQKQQAEIQSAKVGEEYVNTQFQEMTDEGLKFERNELLKFMVDFQKDFGAGSLLDTEGNYDFRKSLSLMQRLQPETEKENTNKTLAAQASKTKVNSVSASKVPMVSRFALRRGNWRDAGI